MIAGLKLPSVIFKTRVREDNFDGPNPFRWQDKTTEDYFENKRVILFSVPGAFTPVCSIEQLPGFDRAYNNFISDFNIDDIYCIAVNDAFTMFKWSQDLVIQHVKLLPDGNGDFTRGIGMLVNKTHLGMGYRSWRYAAIINNGIIEAWFQEPGINNNGDDKDPYIATTPSVIMDYLSVND